MKYYICWLASLLLLSGCTVNPADSEAEYLKNTPRYTMEGRQGYMPGRDIRFGQYHGSVEKDWVNAHGIRILGDMLSDDSLQKVSLKVRDSAHHSASIGYRQACGWDLLSFLNDGMIKLFDFKGKIHMGNKVWTFDDPTRIRFGTQWFGLDKDELSNTSGEVYTVTLDDNVVAELHLSVYLGGLSQADYVWMDESQSADVQLMTALLVTYAATYAPPQCHESENRI
ncbi:hypothetical protein VA7868_03333 [Vibrio aerogenes CECT 7868]|uniref:Lipoprotein n=1 Tax=Vibrio aerogenes CECT 7868 TaxID=1216006 RepID=A0A1M5ZWU1_9VIBR|nr:hypothetical protein [Vibrio aerogenes]SHI28509.1 hypothetical protein VA7868_03333 [Vibrio aerogenes CECT 7868]